MNNHIISLEVENVKRLTAVSLKPKAGLNIVGGNNGQGKSSLLDSIAMALGGKNEIPGEPLRRGSEKGAITMTLSNGLTIKRGFTAKGTSLVVSNSEGARFASPQEMLDKLTSSQMFDPFAFSRQKPAERMATLKKLVGLDLSGLDTQRKTLYDQRTLKNRDVATATHNVAAVPLYPNAPAEEQSASEIYAKIREVETHNAGIEEQRRKLVQIRAAVGQREIDVTTAEKRVQALEEDLARAREALTVKKGQRAEAIKLEQELHGEVERAELRDASEFRRQLDEVGSVNKMVLSNREHSRLKAIANKLQKEADDLTAAIDKIDAQKAAALGAVQYPVEGLGFSESDVIFNGLPFDQASSAEQIKASVAIGAALNPNLRAMLIRDGSMLDDASLETLADLCFEKGLQLFVERVGKGKECSVIIEDGTIYTDENQLAIPGTEAQ